MMKSEELFEMCECGHFGGSSPKIYNMHHDQKHNGRTIAIGHGDCIGQGVCSCDKFVWVKFCDKEGNDIDDNIMKAIIRKKEIEREMTLIRTRQQQYKNGEISNEVD